MNFKIILSIAAILLTCLIEHVAFAEDQKSNLQKTTNATISTTISEKDRENIKVLVVLTITAIEACKKDHPELIKPLDAAFISWRTRNQKYYDYALSDPETLQTSQILLNESRTTPLLEEQCKDTVRALSTPETDIGP